MPLLSREYNFPLVVRARFKDDTQLESLPQPVALVYKKTEQPIPSTAAQTGGGKWVLTKSWENKSAVGDYPGMSFSFSNGSASASKPDVIHTGTGDITCNYSGTNSWTPLPETLIPGQSYSTSLTATSSTTAHGGNSSSHHQTTLWVDGTDVGTAKAWTASIANANLSDSQTATWTVEPGSYAGAKLGIAVAADTCVGIAAYYYEYTWQP